MGRAVPPVWYGFACWGGRVQEPPTQARARVNDCGGDMFNEICMTWGKARMMRHSELRRRDRGYLNAGLGALNCRLTRQPKHSPTPAC